MSRRLAVNPVLSRELRQRVRSRRASVVLTLYLSVLVGAVGLMVWGVQRTAGTDSTAGQGTGRTLFGSILFLVLGLVCFIVPGVAAGAVAGERERLTLVPLQVTLLTPGQVLRGKLLASLAFTTLLLVATLPLLAVAYVIGGVTVPQIGGGLLFVLASAAFLGVVSIWASTVLRRVQRATVVAYGLVGLLVLGTPIAYGVQVVATSRTSSDSFRTDRWESLLLLATNPFLVTADALGHSTDGGGASPFTPSQEALRRRDERRSGQVTRDEFNEGFVVDSGPMTTFGGGFGGAVGPAPTMSSPPMPSPVPFPEPAPVPATMAPVPATAPGMPPPPPFISPPPFDPILPGRFPDPGVEVMPGPREVTSDGGGDLTDRGPIWAWTFGWWILLGGAAYAHASRKLRLPSVDGVRP